MALAARDKLGHFEIVSLLGKGGMGEVYRARDTTLKRDVALKVLPASVSADPERAARFQREAEILAQLDHPNIAPIFGVVESGQTRALALALIDGPTLADLIAAGPLALDDALSIAKQIIGALEYAHERGVVHRDLKPANIKITADGVVKVLDFGLAKVLEDEPSRTSLGDSPTMTLGHTRAGMILGTAAYMSPEQAIGRPVDRRSDIFSFGAVLYEMLTGQRAFGGNTTPDVLEAVVKAEPDWPKLPAWAPAELLRRCLTKDRKQRLQAIGEARIALENPAQPTATTQIVTVHPRPNRLWPALAIFALLGLTALAPFAWTHFREKPEERPLLRLDVDLGPDVSLPLPVSGARDIAISPDGTRIVYTDRPADPTPGGGTIYLRKLDQAQATVLAKGGDPVFSPDGQWIVFDALPTGQLTKISVEGGAVVPVTAANRPGAGVGWSDGAGFVISQRLKGLARIGPAGGNPDTVTELASGETFHSYPKVLPGDKAVLFVSQAGVGAVEDDRKSIEVVTLADHHRKLLVRGGTSPRYLPTGHLIYTNKSTLFAVPFDLDKLEVRGAPVPLVSDIASSQNGEGQFDISLTGTLICRKAGEAAVVNATIQWIDPSGKRQPLLAKAGQYLELRISPDGKRLALHIVERGQSDLWVYDIQRETMTRLTSGTFGRLPEWSPDGKYILFTNNAGGLSFTRSDGATQPQALLPAKGVQAANSFSPDGKRLSYTEVAGFRQLFTVALEEQGGQLKAGQPELFLKSETANNYASIFSPDGHWLAYLSNESGRDEIYVRPFPPPASGLGGKWQISNGGAARAAMWSHNGHVLYYQQRDQLMAVSYTTNGDTFVAEKPRVWIPKLGATGAAVVAPDDKRVAAITPVEAASAPQQEHEIVMLVNFFDEVRRRVPQAK